MDLNKATLIGNVVRDPESKKTADGQTVTRFALAVTTEWVEPGSQAKQHAVDFHDVVARGKLGDIIQSYVKKGSKVYVEGRLRQHAYVGTTGSTRRWKTELVADNLILLGHRSTLSRSRADTDTETAESGEGG